MIFQCRDQKQSTFFALFYKLAKKIHDAPKIFQHQQLIETKWDWTQHLTSWSIKFTIYLTSSDSVLTLCPDKLATSLVAMTTSLSSSLAEGTSDFSFPALSRFTGLENFGLANFESTSDSTFAPDTLRTLSKSFNFFCAFSFVSSLSLVLLLLFSSLKHRLTVGVKIWYLFLWVSSRSEKSISLFCGWLINRQRYWTPWLTDVWAKVMMFLLEYYPNIKSYTSMCVVYHLKQSQNLPPPSPNFVHFASTFPKYYLHCTMNFYWRPAIFWYF